MNWRRGILFLVIVTVTILSTGLIAAASVDADKSSATQGTVNLTGNSGRNYALVIGINEYWHLPRLRASVNNAQLVANCLQEDKKQALITILIDKDATKDKILEVINRYRREMSAADSLVIYYSGHGGRATLTLQAERGLANSKSHFEGVNVFDEGIMPVDSTYAIGKQITSSELAGLFSNLPTKKVSLIIDSSYDQAILPMVSPSFESPNAMMRPRSTIRELNMFGYNVVVAGDWNELSRVDRFNGKEYGVFTYFLVQGIRSHAADLNLNGQLTVREIFDYTRGKTLQYIGVQHPQLYRGRDVNIVLWEI